MRNEWVIAPTCYTDGDYPYSPNDLHDRSCFIAADGTGMLPIGKAVWRTMLVGSRPDHVEDMENIEEDQFDDGELTLITGAYQKSGRNRSVR